MQDIFEMIDNFRGGDGGSVKLKDLIRFLRGVCENIDQNFKVGAFFNSYFFLLIIQVTLLLNQLSLHGEKVTNF